MARKRDAEAHGDGKLRDAAGAAQERGEIVGQRILRAGDAGAGDEIEKTGRTCRDFRKTFIRGSRRAKKNRVEVMRGKNAAVVFGFFGREVGGQNSISTGGCSGPSEFFGAHLPNWVVGT